MPDGTELGADPLVAITPSPSPMQTDVSSFGMVMHILIKIAGLPVSGVLMIPWYISVMFLSPIKSTNTSYCALASNPSTVTLSSKTFAVLLLSKREGEVDTAVSLISSAYSPPRSRTAQINVTLCGCAEHNWKCSGNGPFPSSLSSAKQNQLMGNRNNVDSADLLRTKI